MSAASPNDSAPRRDKQITFRASDAECGRWTENAAARGLSVSEFLRVVANEAELPRVNLATRQRARLLELVLLLAQRAEQIPQLVKEPTPDAMADMIELWLGEAEQVVGLLQWFLARAEEVVANGAQIDRDGPTQ